MERPGRRHRQPHHITPSGCAPFIEDTHDNFGAVPSRYLELLVKTEMLGSYTRNG